MKIFGIVLISMILGFLSCNSDRGNPSTVVDPIDYDAKFKTLGISLSVPSSPVANYVNITQAGNTLYLAGKGPTKPEGGYVTGKVGRDLSEEEGYEAARLTAIAQLSVLKDYLVKRETALFGDSLSSGVIFVY